MRSRAPSRSRSRKRVYKGGFNQADMIMARRAKIQRGPELKYVAYVVTALTTVPLPSAALVQCLSSVAQGTTNSTRLGNRQTSAWMSAKVNIWHNSAVSPTSMTRVIIIQDLLSTGTDPTYTDILASAAPNALPSINNRNRFRFLKDECFALADGGPAVGEFKFFKKEKTQQNYDGTGSGNNTDGHYFLVIAGWDSTGLASNALYTTSIRFTFRDM